jgi:hypothetical protein
MATQNILTADAPTAAALARPRRLATLNFAALFAHVRDIIAP